MAAGEAAGSGFRARAGALTLLYVAGSLDREHLLELLEAALSGELPPVPSEEELAEEDELEDEGLGEELEDEEELGEGEPPLATLQPIVPRPRNPFGPNVKARTSSKGEEFLFVAGAIERWLGNCPEGPLELGMRGAKALAPLICGWSATVTHALAPEPLTLAELGRAVGILDYEATADHVEAMERSGQVEVRRNGGEPRYALTDWGREGISPIVAAVRFELRYPEDDVLPPDVFDVEAAFQMALPLLRLPPDLRGACRLGVRLPGEEPLMAGATVEVDRGCVLASSALLDQAPQTWATGAPLDWCDTVVDPAAAKLDVGGDTRIALALIDALHERLFGARA